MNNEVNINSIQVYAERYMNYPTEYNFSKLYFRILPGLKKFIIKLMINYKSQIDYDLLDDILSRTFQKILENLNSYHECMSSFSTWTYTIARNELIGEYKKRYNSKKISLSNYNRDNNKSFEECLETVVFTHCTCKDDYICVEDSMIDGELMERNKKLVTLIVYEIYTSLDLLYRDIIIDRELNNISYKDLAMKYNIPIDTIKSRIKIGRETLVKQFLQKTQYKSLNVLDELSKFLMYDREVKRLTCKDLAMKYDISIDEVNKRLKKAFDEIKSNILELMKMKLGG